MYVVFARPGAVLREEAGEPCLLPRTSRPGRQFSLNVVVIVVVVVVVVVVVCCYSVVGSISVVSIITGYYPGY